jgi:hypothetical protein
MSNQRDITALVELLPTEGGGRTGPTPSDFLACTIETAAGNFDCRLYLDGAPLSPGERRTLGIRLLDASAALEVLKPGTCFYLWSCGRIGGGSVLTRP